MVRIRQRWLVVALGLGLGLSGACKKDDKANSTGDKTAEKSADATTDDLALLPVDSDVVIGINLGQVQQSALWKQFVEPKLSNLGGEAGRRMNDLKAKCGYDPMTSVKSIAAGIKGTGDRPSGVVVAHGLDKAKILDCVDKMKAEIAQEGAEVTRDGDFLQVKDKQGNQAAIKFINDSTAFMVLGDNADAAGVKAVAAATSTLKSSAPFLEMYKKVKTADSLWFLINAKSMEKLPIPVKPKAVFGSLNVTDGLALDLRVRFEKPEEAADTAKLATEQAKQAAAYVDKAEFTAEGTELHGSVVMSNQKLQTVVTQFGGMARMLMGGGPQ